MRIKMNKIITIIAIVTTSLVITGCAGMKNMTPGQQAMTEGCAGGALIGSALGAGAGALLGGGQAAAIGAGLGGALGTAAGCAYANSVIDENTQLTNLENSLNAQIQEAATHNQNLTTEIDELKRTVAQLRTDVRRRRISRTQLTAQKQVIEQKLAVERQKEADLNTSINQITAAKQQQQSPKTIEVLDKKIVELQAQLSKMKDNNKALASIKQRI